MIDIITPSIFPNNVILGVATGYVSQSEKHSFFETPYYDFNKVIDARKTLESLYKDKISKIYYQKQIHSDSILIDNIPNKHDDLKSDAIISNIPDKIYNVSIADCQAVLIYDPTNKAIAAIHSGWKGSSLNIVNKTLDRMKSIYNTNSPDLLVYLAPSASVNNYEVGKEFLDLFPNTTIQIEDKYYYDNRKEIINQLLLCGVRSKNIESNNDCTISNYRYHSYRRDKNESGRMSAFIGIIAT